MEDHHKFCRVSYWREAQSEDGRNVRTSCGQSDEWTHAIVGPLSSYSPYGEQELKRGEEYRLGSLLSLLRQAYEAGRRAKLREVRAVLEVA